MKRPTHSRNRAATPGLALVMLTLALAACVPPPPPPIPTARPTPTARPAATPGSTPTAEPTPEPSLATPAAAGAVIVAFTVQSPVLCGTEAVVYPTISWEVTGATGIFIAIDGPGVFNSDPFPTTYSVNAHGSQEIPFACGQGSHTYTLSTVGGSPDAEQTKTITAVRA